MDSAKLILSEPVLPPRPLAPVLAFARKHGGSLCKKISTEKPNETSEFSEEKKKEIAKDFESVLLNKILDEMKETIGDWGFEKDEACEQVQGIFWLYLARDIASKGGFGLWKDIYKFLANAGWQPQSPEGGLGMVQPTTCQPQAVLGDATQPTEESLNKDL